MKTSFGGVARRSRFAAMLATLGVALCGALSVAGCGGGSDGDAGQVRLVNASPGYSALDLYLDDGLVSSAVAYGSASGYVSVSSGTHVSAVTRSGGSTYLASTSGSFTSGAPVTLVAYGWDGALKTVAFTDTQAAPASGKAKLLIYNTATDAGNVDVYLSGSTDTIGDATGVAYAVSGGTAYSGGYQTVASGTYRVRVTVAGDSSDVILDVQGVSLSSQQVAALVLTPTTGGKLVGGILITQGGSVSALATTQARARVVSAVTGGASVVAAFNGTTLASAATAPSIGSYALVTAGTAAPTVTVNGSTLASATQAVSAGGDYTLLVWGSASAPQLTWISDDNRLPTSSTGVKMRLVHGVSDLSATTTLAVDYAAIADGIAQGSASSYATLSSGTASSLVVSTAGNSALYSLSDITLAAKGVYTVFMLGSSASPQGALRRER